MLPGFLAIGFGFAFSFALCCIGVLLLAFTLFGGVGLMLDLLGFVISGFGLLAFVS